MSSTPVPTDRRARAIVMLLAASVGLMMTGYGIVMPVFARQLDELGALVLSLVSLGGVRAIRPSRAGRSQRLRE